MQTTRFPLAGRQTRAAAGKIPQFPLRCMAADLKTDLLDRIIAGLEKSWGSKMLKVSPGEDEDDDVKAKILAKVEPKLAPLKTGGKLKKLEALISSGEDEELPDWLKEALKGE